MASNADNQQPAASSYERRAAALIMKGGGVKGLALVGAILELEKYYHFTCYVGTSAGAIAAGLLAAGCTPSELEKILRTTKFRRFNDGGLLGRWKNLLFHQFLHPGNEFERWLEQNVAEAHKRRTGNIKLPKLSQLERWLTVYAAQEDEGAVVFDSTNSNRDSTLTHAIRCSMSIPIFFRPALHNDRPAFDGGLFSNFPAKRWTTDNPGHDFIGVYLGAEAYPRVRSRWILSQIINTVVQSDDDSFIDANKPKIVVIDPTPVETTDFNISQAEAEFLILEGKAAALEHLHEHVAPKTLITSEVTTARSEANKARRNAIRTRKWRKVRRIAFAALVVLALATPICLGIKSRHKLCDLTESTLFGLCTAQPDIVGIRKETNFLRSNKESEEKVATALKLLFLRKELSGEPPKPDSDWPKTIYVLSATYMVLSENAEYFQVNSSWRTGIHQSNQLLDELIRKCTLSIYKDGTLIERMRSHVEDEKQFLENLPEPRRRSADQSLISEYQSTIGLIRSILIRAGLLDVQRQ